MDFKKNVSICIFILIISTLGCKNTSATNIKKSEEYWDNKRYKREQTAALDKEKPKKTIVLLIGSWGYHDESYFSDTNFDNAIQKDIYKVEKFFDTPITKNIYPSVNRPIIIRNKLTATYRYIETRTLHPKGFMNDEKIVLNKSDDIILYYSGHGGVYEDTEILIPSDTEKKYLQNYMIEIKKIAAGLSQLNVNSVTMFFDMCLTNESKNGTDLNLEIELEESTFNRPKVYIYIATIKGNKTELDKSGSFFTQLLIEGLRGSADINEDGFISNKELKKFFDKKRKKISFTASTKEDNKKLLITSSPQRFAKLIEDQIRRKLLKNIYNKEDQTVLEDFIKEMNADIVNILRNNDSELNKVLLVLLKKSETYIKHEKNKILDAIQKIITKKNNAFSDKDQ